jgi:transposase InsO family protein
VFGLAAVRDAFSNRIVGWRCSDRCDTDLIFGALEYAVWSRDVRDGQVVHHSDRGSNPGTTRRCDSGSDSMSTAFSRQWVRLGIPMIVR